jgi:UDP-N-acetylglucosamine 2-epimerase (non-hydrolysing)
LRYLLVFGTRPEAIKMAPLVNYLKQHPIADYKVCVTAQHRELLDVVLCFFQIIPDYDLDLMVPDQRLNQLSGRMFMEIDTVLEDYKPDLVFVHGDTTTSTICALAAFYRGIRVAHIEAGLRTFNRFSPFPEEINRQLTGRLADLHFAPTQRTKEHLVREGVSPETICISGNTVIDALFMAKNKLASSENLEPEILRLKNLLDQRKRMILVTGHRRENFGQGFQQICDALAALAEREEVEIVYPVHLNPNVLGPVHEKLAKHKNIFLIDPVGYPTFVWLMQRAYLILTDSGGVQEEAPALGKPVIVMRDTTERPEVVEAGAAILTGSSKSNILNSCNQLLDDPSKYALMAIPCMPYGRGNASEIIFNFVLEFFDEKANV